MYLFYIKKHPIPLAHLLLYHNCYIVTLMTFALCEKEKSVKVVGLKMADAFTDGITGLNTRGEVSNKSAISDVYSDLKIDERDDEFILLFLLTLLLYC